ncbi:MAG: class I SAM-dependent methyltransferase, partial [Deltaproteobacteria bacterium]|nr:class I SAM-dependent methyltransferase [Deltaproteobacteria bacterium]
MPDSIAVTLDRFAQVGLDILQTIFADCRPKNFSVRMWDGTTWGPEEGHKPIFTMVINRPGALRRMFLQISDLSLGEAYIYGDFDIEGDFESAFMLEDYFVGLRLGITERLRLARQLRKLPSDDLPSGRRRPAPLSGPLHSLARDRETVRYHYDVSNAFYALWLDRRMVYSTAYFMEPEEDLDTAQVR